MQKTSSTPSKQLRKVKDKLFVVRKYIMAKSAKEALKKERKVLPDDCYVHDQWQNTNVNNLESAIGFTCNTDDDN